jgi:hypothetical protein
LLYRLDALVVGEGWMSRPRLDQVPRVTNGVRVYEQEDVAFYRGWATEHTGGKLDLRQEVTRIAPDKVQLRITSRPELDTRYAMPNNGVGIGMVLGMNPYFDKGVCRVEFADGSSEDLPYPAPPRWGKAGVKAVLLRTAKGEATRFSFDPALFLHSDNAEIRLFTQREGKTPAGETMTQTMTIELPGRMSFEPENRWLDTSEWFRYENEDDFSPGSVIGVEDWLDKPAGKHGWLEVRGDDFAFADDTEARFFGTNISWDDMACPHEEADKWNDRWAKHGVNLVRLHKFINHGWAGILTEEDHMVPDPEEIKLFDYYHASARKRGVYTAWSAVFHMKLTPADRERVRHYDEVLAARKDGDVLGLINIAPDIQDLLIAQTLNLLTRTNTVTGIRYADDPALAYIELHNEDDIFFPFDNYERIEKAFPTYFNEYQERFCGYLKRKYGSQQGLEKAWGTAYPTGKSLAAGDIRPEYRAWDINQGQMTPRIADSMHFMYTEQLGFYKRFKQAIRDAGYGGAICGSCWQASCWLGHLYNTLTDYEVGFIDRHNYSGTPLNRPGVGNMSVGFQQVKNRPFNFSEWGGGPIAVPTVAIYGQGLQGWDASCQFSSNQPGIFNTMKRGVNGCCDDFIQVSQYPALARSVLRGDVKEGDVVARRQISIPGLFEGDVGLYEHFSLLGGGANTKEFSSVVPATALMAGRVVLEYMDGPVPENPVIEDVGQFVDNERQVVRSNTGQLVWDYSGNGFYTVDTPGTQAVVGHVAGKKIELGDVVISTAYTPALKLYVTALANGVSISTGKRILVTALGRDANTGMVADAFSARPLQEGGEPLLIEPVTATITVKRGGVRAVRPLSHSGRVRNRMQTVPVSKSPAGDSFTIDGRVTRTVYYLVEMD